MSLYSPIRSRRASAKNTEKTEQFITFQLRHEWFALPIYAVQKVIQMDKIYGDPQGTGISLTNYQGQEVVVVDVGRRIFGETAAIAPRQIDPSLKETRFMLLVQSEKGETIGLPIDSAPALRRVPDSAFAPIPEAYLAQGNVRAIGSTTIQLSDHPTLFLLDANQLV
jgi:chemotaxis signal transduction protein